MGAMPPKEVPAQLILRYNLTHNGANSEDSHYFDLAKNLSEINRRFYRQGKVYHVSGISFHTTSTTKIKVCVAPNTWVVRNAWNRGKQLWDKMNRKVTSTSGGRSRLPRYHDYKVYLDSVMPGEADRPQPLDSGDNVVEGAEDWVYSEYESPDGTTGSDSYTAHLLGDHIGSPGSFTTVGLVYSYAESRPTVETGAPRLDIDGDDDPLVNLFDDGTQTDEIAEDLMFDNNQPPYSHGADSADYGESYPGSKTNHPKSLVVATTATMSAAPMGYISGFSCIAGLLEIETKSNLEQDTIEMIVYLAPGTYKGVAASAI